jgi:hypothetical protein
VAGLPFIGEGGFYPSWLKDRPRWVFQRTLVTVGGLMAGYAELVAARTPKANQVIVWVPQPGAFIRRLVPGALHEERQQALSELGGFHLRCYGDDCALGPAQRALNGVVSEGGLAPEQWELHCPTCHGPVGPDLALVNARTVTARWVKLGRPSLDSPAASAAFRSAAPINDLSSWIGKNNPSQLELAYLGQQIWPNLVAMLANMVP